MRDAWASRILKICKDKGWYRSERKQGLRELARTIGLKGAGQLPGIVNWRDYKKPVALTHKFAKQIAAGTGYRTSWLLDGELPERDGTAGAEDAQGKILDLVERLHGPVQPGVLEEYLRYRMRDRLRQNGTIAGFADELSGNKRSAFMRKAAMTVWLREPIASEAVSVWLDLLQRRGVTPVAINTWWERNGRLLGQMLDMLAKDPSPRGRGIARARTDSRVSDDAVLAAIESGELSDAASEATWNALVVNANQSIKRGVEETLATMRPRRKSAVGAPRSKRAPKSSRAPRSTRKTATED
jgi:hypothetical protein